MKAALVVMLAVAPAAADPFTSGDVYLIRADGYAPEVSCEKWHIDASTHSLTHRRGKLHEELIYEPKADTITFTSFTYRIDGANLEDEDTSPDCKLTAEVERVKGGWRVGTARWFSTKKACAASLEKRERVGSTFGCPSPDDFTVFATRFLAEFADVVRTKGTMYGGAKCSAVKLDNATLDADARIVKFSTGSCTKELSYAPIHNGIAIDAARLYFDVERCRRHERARAKVASYLPPVAPVDISATLASCN